MSKNTLSEQFAPAFIQALIVCIVRMFTIPWSIWKGATIRLSQMRTLPAQEENQQSASEFPVLEWSKICWDGIIFLSWIVIPLFSFIGAWYGSERFTAGLFALFSAMFMTYFLTILLSLLKESMFLMVSVALNIEKLVNKP